MGKSKKKEKEKELLKSPTQPSLRFSLEHKSILKKSKSPLKNSPKVMSSDSSDSLGLKIANLEPKKEKHVQAIACTSSDSENETFSEKRHSLKMNHEKKPKEKIYSSSEEGETAPEAPAPLPKSDTIHDYFEGWPKPDVMELISRMKKEIPEYDKLKYSSRVEKIDWEKVKFNMYTAAECQKKWKFIEKKMRGFRILQELLADAELWVEHPWTDFYRGNKKKNLKHPDMPKKPLSSYMIFYISKKNKIAQKHPGLSMTELSKVIAEKYNNLSADKKAKYSRKASKVKEEYQEKLQKFMEDHPTELAKLTNASNKKAALSNKMGVPGSTKPVTPLKMFLDDKMKLHKADPNANIPQLMAEYKEKWKTMSSKKKIPWIRWANESEQKYLEEIKAYKAENPNFDPKYKSVLSKEEKNILLKTDGKPDKPPGSAYALFSREKLKDPVLKIKFPTPKERLQEIAKMWKNVAKIDKNLYQEKVKQLTDNYKLEYASYLESLPEDKREEEMASNLPKRKPKSDDTPSLSLKKMKLKSDNDFPDQMVKKKTPKPTLESIKAKEPAQPPTDALSLFLQNNEGTRSEKKLRKYWSRMDDQEKSEYEAKLRLMKDDYIENFKRFLTALTPEELMIFRQGKEGAHQDEPESNDSSSDESETEKVPNTKGIDQPSTSDSSSSSSDSSSDVDSDAF